MSAKSPFPITVSWIEFKISHLTRNKMFLFVLSSFLQVAYLLADTNQSGSTIHGLFCRECRWALALGPGIGQCWIPGAVLALRGAELGSPCPACLSFSSGNATGEWVGRPWQGWMDKCPLGVQRSCGAAFTSSLEAGEREQLGKGESIPAECISARMYFHQH